MGCSGPAWRTGPRKRGTGLWSSCERPEPDTRRRAPDAEIHDPSLQFVRKLPRFRKPSKPNEAGFNEAVDAVAGAARPLLHSLVASADPRSREAEAARARARAEARFGVS